jgi:hypothetical protein
LFFETSLLQKDRELKTNPALDFETVSELNPDLSGKSKKTISGFRDFL